MSKECIWHDATKELPEIDKEVIVIYDNGYLSFNHRPHKKWTALRPNGEKVTYEVKVDEDGWCDYSKGLTKGHKIVLWTENPMEEQK